MTSTETYKKTLKAKIYELSDGCGIPQDGALITQVFTTSIYRLLSRGCIQTGEKGNWVEAELEYIGDPYDITEEEYDSCYGCELVFE